MFFNYRRKELEEVKRSECKGGCKTQQRFKTCSRIIVSRCNTDSYKKKKMNNS